MSGGQRQIRSVSADNAETGIERSVPTADSATLHFTYPSGIAIASGWGVALGFGSTGTNGCALNLSLRGYLTAN
jgi:hypothetical protein